jgi:hypothetical protein
MPHLPRSKLGAIFDLGEQLGLDPDAAMRDLLGVGLSLSDQRLERPASPLPTLLLTRTAFRVGL